MGVGLTQQAHRNVDIYSSYYLFSIVWNCGGLIMPYIDNDKREQIDPLVTELCEILANMGDLNYTITRLCDAYLTTEAGIRYSRLNDLVGALECAKLELYRRVAAPYEDIKAEENGDAYECVEQLPKPEPTRVSDIPQKETQKAKKGFWKKIMGS